MSRPNLARRRFLLTLAGAGVLAIGYGVKRLLETAPGTPIRRVEAGAIKDLLLERRARLEKSVKADLASTAPLIPYARSFLDVFDYSTYLGEDDAALPTMAKAATDLKLLGSELREKAKVATSSAQGPLLDLWGKYLEARSLGYEGFVLLRKSPLEQARNLGLAGRISKALGPLYEIDPLVFAKSSTGNRQLVAEEVTYVLVASLCADAILKLRAPELPFSGRDPAAALKLCERAIATSETPLSLGDGMVTRPQKPLLPRLLRIEAFLALKEAEKAREAFKEVVDLARSPLSADEFPLCAYLFWKLNRLATLLGASLLRETDVRIFEAPPGW